mmetsp:Transcript_22393/g.49042  ORF Transcript_22393/g.49042 Transcript_22393/m.49042 type:complete len:901 (-) Transcript_22393:399-3101(-)
MNRSNSASSMNSDGEGPGLSGLLAALAIAGGIGGLPGVGAVAGLGGLAKALAASSSSGGNPGNLKAGDKVRVRPDVREPKYKWGNVSHGMVGTIKQIVGDVCRVDFPAIPGLWNGCCAEMEAVGTGSGSTAAASSSSSASSSGPPAVGASVRIRREVSEPRYGWGEPRVTHEMVGKVVHSGANSDLHVQFPNKTLIVHSSDIELVRDGSSPSSVVEVGDKVRVRADIREPKYKWGEAKQGMVGRVLRIDDDGDCIVDYPAILFPWRGLCSEMEVVQPGIKTYGDMKLGDKIEVRPTVSEPKYKWGSVKPGMVGVLKRIDDDGDCFVAFPELPRLWRGLCSEMQKASPGQSSTTTLQVGTKVRYAMQSCTIARVLDADRVMISIPDVGEVEANQTEFSIIEGKESHGNIKVGDRVRVCANVTSPKHGWGNVKPGMVGLVSSIDDDGKCRILFDVQTDAWVGICSEMEVADASPGPRSTDAKNVVARNGGTRIKVGDQVRVRPDVEEPAYGWGSVRRGMVGLVSDVDDADAVSGDCKVFFDSLDDAWTGRCSDMEVVNAGGSSTSDEPPITAQGAGPATVQVGDRVRVQASVREPRHGWGGVQPGLVGLVIAIDNDGDCKVMFDGRDALWTGDCSEMEIVHQGTNNNNKSNDLPQQQRPRDAARGSMKVGDWVQVRADVQTPSLGWGGLKHGMVGLAIDVDESSGECKVLFEGRDSEWKGICSEMEVVNAGQVEQPVDIAGLEAALSNEAQTAPPDPPEGPGGAVGGPPPTGLTVGSKVQVRPDIAEPSLGWGSVKRGDVGTVLTLEDPIAEVRFENEASWTCLIAEIEEVKEEVPTPPPPPPPPPAKPECSICFEMEADTVLVPCGHAATCYTCAESVNQGNKQCPICRVEFDSFVRYYIP